ncbi:MAG: AraC family transcriptional regulator [Gammaproteobacteria bacterium]|nr:MAG: AraC family transcriptional regulator [Gammaproteobacteria bacterium]
MPNNRMRYSSVEMLQGAFSQIGEYEFTQSAPGRLDALVTSTAIGGCLVYGSRVDRSLVITGQRPADCWTIAPITAECADGYYRGSQLDCGDLLLLDPAGEVFQHFRPGHSQNVISIPLPLAQRIIQAEHHALPEEIWGQWRVKSDPRVSLELDGMLRRALAAQGPTSVDGHSEDEFAGRVIALIQSSCASEHPRPGVVLRQRIVARAQELIHGRLENPPTITELCEVSCCSRRALFYAFQSLLGRSPGAHIKMLRLHEARRRILKRRHQRGIQQLAFELGFKHPGQFAIDYARTFGESPSETGGYAGPSVCIETPQRAILQSAVA